MEARNPRGPDRQHRPRRRIDILSAAEVGRLMDACSTRSSSGIRDRSLISFLYASGVRISEALALFPRDVDLDGRSATVQNGKGDQRRRVGLLEDAVAPLQRWLVRRRELGVGDDRVIFCSITRAKRGAAPTQPGRPLAREHVGRVLRRLARRARLPHRVFPHLFRHSHCAVLRARGIDLFVVKAQLGHQHLSTTDRYCHLLGANELPQRLRALGPILAAPARGPREELCELVARMGDAEVARLVAVLKVAE